ncbi:MAG: hypothetical protein WD875_16140 [Pirellulales bacterium]
MTLWAAVQAVVDAAAAAAAGEAAAVALRLRLEVAVVAELVLPAVLVDPVRAPALVEVVQVPALVDLVLAAVLVEQFQAEADLAAVVKGPAVVEQAPVASVALGLVVAARELALAASVPDVLVEQASVEVAQVSDSVESPQAALEFAEAQGLVTAPRLLARVLWVLREPPSARIAATLHTNIPD